MTVPILLPDLGSDRAWVSLWFAEPGDYLCEGDRLIEILTAEGAVTFDVSAPVSGRLKSRLVLTSDVVQPQQILGWIELVEAL